MASQHKWTTPAPHGRRFIAMMIDQVIVQVGAQILIAVSPLHPLLNLLLVLVWALGYFIVLQSQFGWTLGKKVMGLELVVLNQENIPSLGAIVKREIWGRILLNVSFCAGYLMVFFGDSRQGWHDKISGTQVVTTLDPQEGTSIFKIVLGGFATIAGLVAVGIYVLLFTAVPLKQVAQQMEADGFQIEGLAGNLWSGFSIQRLAYENQQAKFEAENIVLHYQNLFSSYMNRKLHIHNLGVGKLSLNILAVKNPFAPAEPGSEANKGQEKDGSSTNIQVSPATAPAVALAHDKQEPMEVAVDRIDINDVSLQYLGKPIAQLPRFFISDFLLKNQKFQIARMWVESNLFLVDIGASDLNKDKVSLSSAQVILRKALKPELLAGDIDLQFKIEGKPANQIWDVQLTGFRKSLTASWKDSQLQITTKGLQPHWYLKNWPGLHSLNISGKGGQMEFITGFPFQGSYQIGKHQFQLVPPALPGMWLPATAQIGKDQVLASVQFKGVTDPEAPFQVSLHSSSTDVSSLLSEIHFAKPASGLTAAESTFLAAQSKFYSLVAAEKSIEKNPVAKEHFVPGTAKRLPAQLPPKKVLSEKQ